MSAGDNNDHLKQPDVPQQGDLFITFSKDIDLAVSSLAQSIAEHIDSEVVNSFATGDMFITSPVGATGDVLKWDSEGCYWNGASIQAPIQVVEITPQEINYTIDNYVIDTTLNECSFTFASNFVPASAITINDANGNLIVNIAYSNGEVTLGKDVEPRFAAREFWTHVAELGGRFEERLQKLEQENAELRTRIHNLTADNVKSCPDEVPAVSGEDQARIDAYKRAMKVVE